MASSSLIDSLHLHPAFQARIHEFHPSPQQPQPQPQPQKQEATKKTQPIKSGFTHDSTPKNDGFVLYLPTVNLRMDQNPAFALACHLANLWSVPCITLAVVVDDSFMPSHFNNNNNLNNNLNRNLKCKKPIVMTSRRLSFILEALSESCHHWSNHGAGVAIRVHAPQCRTPDYLTLALRSNAVVVDEPFVYPYLSLVQRVEKACLGRAVPCFRVDGSTTVPPCSVLTRKKKLKKYQIVNNIESNDGDMIYYNGVPAKAWIWQKKTESLRMNHIQAAMNGEFDAPQLQVRIHEHDFFLSPLKSSDNDTDNCSKLSKSLKNDANIDISNENMIISEQWLDNFPASWKDWSSPAPGVRPWTVQEMKGIASSSSSSSSSPPANDTINHVAMKNEKGISFPSEPELSSFKAWSMTWPGADNTVQPCIQTIGSTSAGMTRWNKWVRERRGLIDYGRRRTDALQPHASSRMSCYLNYGIVSIFRLVHEVKLAQSSKVAGADKFEEEIIKWREMSYAHAFSRGDYSQRSCVPQWAADYLKKMEYSSLSAYGSGDGYSSEILDLHSLASGSTNNGKWDAMQSYLVNTGELHNNVRMTWGKQVVHWGPSLQCNNKTNQYNDIVSNILEILCYLNDRYALDGLSPPSYAGLLWCIGWSDKPQRDGSISKKPASRYKKSEADLLKMESKLLIGTNESMSSNVAGSAKTSKDTSQHSIISSFQRQEQQSTGGSHKRQRKEEVDSSISCPTGKKSTLYKYFSCG